MSVVAWSVFIADDEPAARRGVRQLLATHGDFTVVGEAGSGREVIDALTRMQPQVLFLDIQMPELSGFDVMARVVSRAGGALPAVVFLTAYEQFAVRAFEIDALDYLVKPVSEARFATTIERLRRHLAKGVAAPAPGILVPTSRGTTVVRLEDIDWIAAEDNYARLWVGHTSYLVRETLASLESRTLQAGFVRAHRGALVRLGAVRQLTTSVGHEEMAVLRSGARVPVSRRRRAAFIRALRERTL